MAQGKKESKENSAFQKLKADLGKEDPSAADLVPPAPTKVQ